MNFNASSIESTVDLIDDTVDQLAPIIAPELPEVAIGIPIVDGLRKLIDEVLQSPLVTAEQHTRVAAASTQLTNAVNANPGASS